MKWLLNMRKIIEDDKEIFSYKKIFISKIDWNDDIKFKNIDKAFSELTNH